ncbi:RICIN domain-containing protein [Streptomyces griseoruber]|uniref:RICIN domain-containing protein n=1 Tax=Streptomyces griseoruber TaxID=1943 RepID=UPI00099EB79D|nr:RICIN domain-containing protein [Streptomyces griseoruber]
MVRADGASGEDPTASGDSGDSGDSDARLTDLLRGAPARAYPALRTLRARHEPAVLAYARLCTTSEPAARRLAAEAFTLTARETARGSEPGGAWRHQLLSQVGRVAADWAGDDRASGLDAGLLLVLRTTPAPGGPVPPLPAAFHSLPPRAQGLIWYAVVERETPARIAVLLGLTPEDVTYGTAPALHSLAGAALRLRLAASDDPRCGDFRRLIEESVRPEGARRSPDLEAHRAHCPHCATAYEEQRALRDAPRTALAEGLLPWGGTAYVREERAQEPLAGVTAPVRRLPRRLTMASAAAVAVMALIPLWLVLVPSDDTGTPTGAAAAAPSTAPRVTVTTTVSAPAPTPVPSTTSPSPSATPSPSRTSARPTPSPSPTRAPGGTYAQVVNVATGRCLEVAGDFDNGTDVVTVPCTSSPSQRWRVDAGRGVVQSAADPDFCLDSRGSVDKGVGVWECDSVEGDHGDNLRFTVDADGTVRPQIAILTGMTADTGGGVSLEPLDAGGDQRWRAGAA